MGYATALEKGWEEIVKVSSQERYLVDFLGEKYDVDIRGRKVVLTSTDAPAKDFVVILILHYLAASLKEKFTQSGVWVSFKEIEAGQFYYPAFYEGAIKPIIKKFGSDPEKLVAAVVRIGGKVIKMGDVAVEIPVFPDIFIRVIMWKGDEEFGSEATMLFDEHLTRIFLTEDVAVLCRFLASRLV